MSKYAPLQTHLERGGMDHIPMTFADIERILGFELPSSASRHRAWWSNNPSNSVMTNAWRRAGYVTADVDMAARKLVFRRDGQGITAPAGKLPPAVSNDGAASEARVARPRDVAVRTMNGFLKGYLTVKIDSDLTDPAEPDWPEPDAKWRKKD